MAQSTEVPGFEHDILPLFRKIDIEHMEPYGVLLDQYGYMSVPENAEKVYSSVADAVMPPDEAWPAEKVQLLRAWIDGGRLP